VGSSVVVVAAAGPKFDASLLRHPTTETKTMRCVAQRNRRLFIVTGNKLAFPQRFARGRMRDKAAFAWMNFKGT